MPVTCCYIVRGGKLGNLFTFTHGSLSPALQMVREATESKSAPHISVDLVEAS